MIDCVLLSHPTDPTLCWCPTCQRTLPVRLLHAHRNCAVQREWQSAEDYRPIPLMLAPDPRPEEEQAALVEVCKTCPDYGDPAEGYEMAAVCQLDDPPAYIDTEPCRKKCMVAAYQRRVQEEGGELCGPWQKRLLALIN